MRRFSMTRALIEQSGGIAGLAEDLGNRILRADHEGQWLGDIYVLWPLVDDYGRILNYAEEEADDLHREYDHLMKHPSPADEIPSRPAQRFLEAMFLTANVLNFGCLLYATKRLESTSLGRKGPTDLEQEARLWLRLEIPEPIQAKLRDYLTDVLRPAPKGRDRDHTIGELVVTDGRSLDLSALWLASHESTEFRKEVLGDDDDVANPQPVCESAGEFIDWMRGLPFRGFGAVYSRVRSALRAAYKAEAPRDKTTSRKKSAVGEKHKANVRATEDLAASAQSKATDRLIQRENVKEAQDALRHLVDVLTPKQQKVISQYRCALEQGYRYSGKQGNSLRQFWVSDYERKKRMLARIREDHPRLVSAIEALADAI